eukprot:TRINITY_DN68_c0_g1_i2.p1 TRINITY_DN68_c0_g1~~TRINITY_DN68_c0_g1_i2.p1  ORF type:complete len:141 (+),score=39.48 TRINITY_DN68_c0_g1_i2:114-536(+)
MYAQCDTSTPDNNEACCNENDRPSPFNGDGCFEGSECCPDGTWACISGDATSVTCGNKQLLIGQDKLGEICQNNNNNPTTVNDAYSTLCIPLLGCRSRRRMIVNNEDNSGIIVFGVIIVCVIISVLIGYYYKQKQNQKQM